MDGTFIDCKCYYKHILTGFGYAYPYFYGKVIEGIKAGKFGPEMAEIYEHGTLIGVDASSRAYWCEQCGYVEDMQCLDLYAPKDVEKEKKRVYGRWVAAEKQNTETVDEMGELPYFCPPEENYRLIKEYLHVCPECGSIMKKIEVEDLKDKTCPKCGEKYRIQIDLTLYD